LRVRIASRSSFSSREELHVCEKFLQARSSMWCAAWA